MRGRSRSIGATSPLKLWFQSFSFVLLIALSIAVLLAGRSDLFIVGKLRAWLIDTVAPVAFAVSRPIEAGRHLVNEAGVYLSLKSTVDRLRAENTALMAWQDRARTLDTENQALRALLNMPADFPTRMVSARVIADTSAGFVRGVIVLAGARDGLAKGQAAMTDSGLAGRVLEVGQRASRVMLLTDINSRVPVLVERTRDQAVLAGNNTDQPEIRYLARDADVKIGDRVVTSGTGGAFPPGLPVGEVVGLDEGGIVVATFADLPRLEFLKLVDFGLPGVLMDELGADVLGAQQGGAVARARVQRPIE